MTCHTTIIIIINPVDIQYKSDEKCTLDNPYHYIDQLSSRSSWVECATPHTPCRRPDSRDRSVAS